MSPCWRCNGTREVFDDCWTCEGRGRVCARCDAEFDSCECPGDLDTVSCPDCLGDGGFTDDCESCS